MNRNKLFKGIDTLIVRVSDIEKSKQWYEEKLGFSGVWEDKEMKLVVLNPGGATSLTLWQTARSVKNAGETKAYPVFRTGNAREAHNVLKRSGVEVREITNDGEVIWFLFFDCDGNMLEACEVAERA